MKPIIAIDPGASGGIAWETTKNAAGSECCSMPEGMTAIVDKLREILFNNPVQFTAVIEQVGGYMPGNSGPAAATFARHCGQLECALYCLGIETVEVLPRKWQASMPLTKFETLPKTMPDSERKAELSKRKAIHKNEIKEYVARRFPHCKVTLKTADALGIYLWAKEELNG
jgi:hypothetical protein